MTSETEIKVYFVATPIGNLSELCPRAEETLRNVDIIFCEDTRHSLKLLTHFKISKPLKSYHKFNEKEQLETIGELLSQGKKIAVISDGGMPCISDPGNILVNFLIKENVKYTVISGASAFVNAFVLSGMNAPFTFVGFLPKRSSQRQTLLNGLGSGCCLIFYSSVHDVNEDIKFLAQALGNRRVTVVREISKLFEEIVHGTLAELTLESPRGEYVLVVERGEEEICLNGLSVAEQVQFYVDGGMSKMDAMKQTAKDRGLSKNQIYKQLV